MATTAETLVRDARGGIVPALVPDPSMVRLEPVKRLMLAVLDRAVNDLRTYAVVPTGRGRRLFAEVEAWFRSSTDGAFDFETICQATGLDPDFIRSGLRSSYGAGSRGTDALRCNDARSTSSSAGGIVASAIVPAVPARTSRAERWPGRG